MSRRTGQWSIPGQRGNPSAFWSYSSTICATAQEHAAQLSMFLGQHATPDEALDWVPLAKADEGNEYPDYACIRQDIFAIRFETQRSLRFEGEHHEKISS